MSAVEHAANHSRRQAAADRSGDSCDSEARHVTEQTHLHLADGLEHTEICGAVYTLQCQGWTAAAARHGRQGSRLKTKQDQLRRKLFQLDFQGASDRLDQNASQQQEGAVHSVSIQ